MNQIWALPFSGSLSARTRNDHALLPLLTTPQSSQNLRSDERLHSTVTPPVKLYLPRGHICEDTTAGTYLASASTWHTSSKTAIIMSLQM